MRITTIVIDAIISIVLGLIALSMEGVTTGEALFFSAFVFVVFTAVDFFIERFT